MDLLKDTFGDRLISRFGPVNWPPRSCDLTPLDYFLWGYVKSLVYADKPQTLDHLEDNIRRVIADIRPQMLEKVIENWTSRLDYIRASHRTKEDIICATMKPNISSSEPYEDYQPAAGLFGEQDVDGKAVFKVTPLKCSKSTKTSNGNESEDLPEVTAAFPKAETPKRSSYQQRIKSEPVSTGKLSQQLSNISLTSPLAKSLHKQLHRRTNQDSARKLSQRSLNVEFTSPEAETPVQQRSSRRQGMKRGKRHRSSFNANIKIQNSQIKKVDLPTYLGVTLDPELRFSKHIEQTTNKALGKLNILRKLCGTSWGSRPQTLKSTFCTVIRPVLEYATPIWTTASISVKRKLDSVQHRAAKIIIGAVSSTNNEKAEQECGLPPLESRRKLATIKFTNKLRSYGLDHISRRVFDKWKHSTRLKRSLTLQLELLQPCSKKEDPVTLRQKGLETIAIFSQDNFAIAYTDGSSDRSLSNGGAGIILLLPDGNNYKHKINTGIITSNFTSELVAIREALILYQQNPHVIDSTEGLPLAKEARDIEHKCTTITLDDANAVAKHRIMNHTFKKPLVTEFDCPRIITSTIARLRTEHLKGMKIHPDKTRSYVQCKHCPDLQLTPNHILECQTVATKLLKMGMVPLRDSLLELLYSPDAARIAEAVIKTFDGI
ncbi:RNase H domain-containing protein [Trichonephila clavipes]|nr:RNase H domain-containing protein [Trichonephila clavipes]